MAIPIDAFVVGEPVAVLGIDYENERRGLTARCRCEDGSEYAIAACDVYFPERTKAADYVAAYRLWLGMDPYPRVSLRRRPKAVPDDIDMSNNIDLIVLAAKSNSLSCRVLGTDRVLTLRPSRFWEIVPGEILTVCAAQDMALCRPSLSFRRDQGHTARYTRPWSYTIKIRGTGTGIPRNTIGGSLESR